MRKGYYVVAFLGVVGAALVLTAGGNHRRSQSHIE